MALLNGLPTDVELRALLDKVKEDARHLRRDLPVDSPHNSVLRLQDIARYIGWPIHRLYDRAGWRLTNTDRRKLAAVFQQLNKGRLVKRRVGDEWKLVPTEGPASEALAKMVASPGPKADAPAKTLTMRIDPLVIGGPKLRIL